MSGRSGYGRSRIVGKIIHKPANMMMAGLAPKVGKPGWAIRLYYQRINETMTSSVCEPIKIIKRLFISGDSITNTNLFAGDGLRPNAATAQSAKNAWYAIVYNRKLGWTGAIPPTGSFASPLTLTNVSTTTAPPTVVQKAVIPTTDYLEIPDTQLFGPIGQTVNISLGTPQTAPGTGYGTPGAVWDSVNTSGAPLTNTFLYGFGGGSGDMAYITTNPAHLGGYALLFNITQIISSSFSGTDNFTGGVTMPTVARCDQFREDLALMTVEGNNIGIKYTAGPSGNLDADGNLKTVEDCFGVSVSAPIGSFAIAPVTGLPTISDYLTN